MHNKIGFQSPKLCFNPKTIAAHLPPDGPHAATSFKTGAVAPSTLHPTLIVPNRHYAIPICRLLEPNLRRSSARGGRRTGER